jgi:hypothetical protein
MPAGCWKEVVNVGHRALFACGKLPALGLMAREAWEAEPTVYEQSAHNSFSNFGAIKAWRQLSIRLGVDWT